MNTTSFPNSEKYSTQLTRPALATFSLVLMIALALIAVPALQAQTFTVIHSFTGGGDGSVPYDGLTTDIAGNLYGTTYYGGTGLGTVFKLRHSGSGWILAPLYNFTRGQDGFAPLAWVDIARDGTLYGTTAYGGLLQCDEMGDGCGTVFHLTPSATVPKSALAPWTKTAAWLFGGGSEGKSPHGDLIFDLAGNIYGTTTEGGDHNCGAIYQLTPSGGGWEETTLYSAQGENFCNELHRASGPSPKTAPYSAQGNGDGSAPVGGVVFDSSGNLYGVFGLDGPYGGGAVYELSPTGSGWTERILYDFTGGNDGGNPIGGLNIDSVGNLYGTTSRGGGSSGCGTVFELTSANGGWTFNTIYSFPGAPGGCGPQVKLTIDSAGNLYGATGGAGAYGFGLVFKLTKANGGWVSSSLHDFSDGSDGTGPETNLVFDASGNLYGTTAGGGAYGGGVVFEITP
ncbi:MAG: choice-of-anchor tandem repeat GloVer-containing protein [Candidatus Korobacteraceae bacterium]